MEHPFILLVLSRHAWTRSRHQLWIVHPLTIPAKSAARHGTHGNGSHAKRNCGKRGSLCRHHGYHRARRLDYHRKPISGCNGSLCCLDRAHGSDHLFVLHPDSSRLFQKAVHSQKSNRARSGSKNKRLEPESNRWGRFVTNQPLPVLMQLFYSSAQSVLRPCICIRDCRTMAPNPLIRF